MFVGVVGDIDILICRRLHVAVLICRGKEVSLLTDSKEFNAYDIRGGNHHGVVGGIPDVHFHLRKLMFEIEIHAVCRLCSAKWCLHRYRPHHVRLVGDAVHGLGAFQAEHVGR